MTYLLAAFILASFISDVRRSLIPNALTVSAAGMGLVYHFAFDGWDGVLRAAVGLSAGFVILVMLYAVGALGAGDVKLFAAVGAMMGAVFVWQSIMYSLIYAGLIAAFLLIVRGKIRPTGRKIAFWLLSIIALKNFASFKQIQEQELLHFPFMYAVLPGVITAWYYSRL